MTGISGAYHPKSDILCLTFVLCFSVRVWCALYVPWTAGRGGIQMPATPLPFPTCMLCPWGVVAYMLNRRPGNGGGVSEQRDQPKEEQQRATVRKWELMANVFWMCKNVRTVWGPVYWFKLCPPHSFHCGRFLPQAALARTERDWHPVAPRLVQGSLPAIWEGLCPFDSRWRAFPLQCFSRRIRPL